MAGDGKKYLPKAEAKLEMVKLMADGWKLQDTLAAVGRSIKTYHSWRAEDPYFCDQIDGARSGTSKRGILPNFPEFCRRYLGQPLYKHQLQWVDLLEGRTPRQLHESQVYEPGDPKYILVNTPPEHAKTSTLSINYAVWRLIRDPNIKIMIVSKTQDMAKQILWAIKNRLTHPQYERMQQEFGPVGGWKASSDTWTADKVYLGSERDTKDKDPTLRAVGIGGQVYGSRVDLTFVDDAVVLANAHEYEKQIRWRPGSNKKC